MSEIENTYVVRTLADLSDEEREAWERSRPDSEVSPDRVAGERALDEHVRQDLWRLTDAELKLADGLRYMGRAILILSAVAAVLTMVLASLLVIIVLKS